MNEPYVVHRGDGSRTDFDFAFPYLFRDHVRVLVGGVDVAFEWLNDSLVRVEPAPVEAAPITIRRDTPTVPVYVIQDNRPIPAKFYNTNLQQALYVAEERLASLDLSLAEIGATAEEITQARADALQAVEDARAAAAAALSSEDVVRLNAANALASEVAARSSEVAAAGSAGAAAASSSDAGTHAASALTARSGAEAAKALAEAARDAAGVARTGAETARDTASSLAITAGTHADAAAASAALANGMPIGTIMHFAADTPPDGWLVCDGTAVTALYPDLQMFLAAAGSPYGVSSTPPVRLNRLANTENFGASNWTARPSATVTPLGDTAKVVPADGVFSLYSACLNYLPLTYSVGPVALSAEFKPDGLRYAQIGISNNAGYTTTATFDLQAGQVAFIGTHPSVAKNLRGLIYPAGDGYWRCVFLFDWVLGTSSLHIGGSVSSPTQRYGRDLVGDGISGVLVRHPQVTALAYDTIYQHIGAGGEVLSRDPLLPDLRGEFVRGWDAGRGVDAGRVFGSAQGDAIRNITGKFDPGGNIGGKGVGNYTGPFQKETTPSLGSNQGGNSDARFITFDASRVVPTADENRPRNVALLPCIRAYASVVNVPGQADLDNILQQTQVQVDDALDRVVGDAEAAAEAKVAWKRVGKVPVGTGAAVTITGLDLTKETLISFSYLKNNGTTSRNLRSRASEDGGSTWRTTPIDISLAVNWNGNTLRGAMSMFPEPESTKVVVSCDTGSAAGTNWYPMVPSEFILAGTPVYSTRCDTIEFLWSGGNFAASGGSSDEADCIIIYQRG